MRWLFQSRTRIVVGMFLLLGVACSGRTTTLESEQAAPAPKPTPAPAPVRCGQVRRAFLAHVRRHGPSQPGQCQRQPDFPQPGASRRARTKNIKWSAKLGTKSLRRPRRRRRPGLRRHQQRSRAIPKQEDDKGVLHVLPRIGRQVSLASGPRQARSSDGTDGAEYGIVSSPCVDGNRVYYVSNRCEVVCADAAGDGTARPRSSGSST